MHSTQKNSKIHSSTELSKSWQLLSIAFISLLVSLSTLSSPQISPRIFLAFAHLGISVWGPCLGAVRRNPAYPPPYFHAAKRSIFLNIKSSRRQEECEIINSQNLMLFHTLVPPHPKGTLDLPVGGSDSGKHQTEPHMIIGDPTHLPVAPSSLCLIPTMNVPLNPLPPSQSCFRESRSCSLGPLILPRNRLLCLHL